MANFLFWLFTLATALLIPACMLYFGRRFQTRPPKSINTGYGYRSTRSMRSQEAWAVLGSGWLARPGGLPGLDAPALWPGHRRGGHLRRGPDGNPDASISGSDSRHGAGPVAEIRLIERKWKSSP